MICICLLILSCIYSNLWLLVDDNFYLDTFLSSVSTELSFCSDDMLSIADLSVLFSLINFAFSFQRNLTSSCPILDLFRSVSNEITPNRDFGVSLSKEKFLSFWVLFWGCWVISLLFRLMIEEGKETSSFIEYHFLHVKKLSKFWSLIYSFSDRNY